MQLTGMMLAAAADQALTMGERVTMGLQVLLFGMAVVFSVLILIWGILVLFRVIFYDIPNKKKAPAKPAETAPVKEAAPEPEPVPETIEEPEADEAEVVAAITAAVALMLDKPQTSFRVVSFRRTAWK